MSEFSPTLELCRERAIALLRSNLTPHGVLAASRTEQAERRRYTRIVGRDAAICALGMAARGDSRLLDGAVASLDTLARHQADNGQIPKYVDPERGEADFWYLGCIDATLWWLIAAGLLQRQLPHLGLAPRWQDTAARALGWLHCQEHPRLALVQQNEASDWADIMPRSGFVLYSNVLWHYVKWLYDLPKRRETYFHCNHLFFPFTSHVPDYRRLRLLSHYVRNRARDKGWYFSFVNFSFWGEEGDVFGNLLALLCGVADEGRSHRVLREVVRTQKGAPYPVRVVAEPIGSDHILWREYMGRHRQNVAWQYHNGGIWPFVGGFWALALLHHGKRREALTVLDGMALTAQARDWEFNEWFHGQSGEPMGMPGQSWNAAMLLLCYESLRGRWWPVP